MILPMTVRYGTWGALEWAAVVVTLPWLTACGGAEFGMDVRVPPERQYALSDVSAKTAVLQFPKDALLNIYETQRSSTGNATAQSKATPEGTAFCSTAGRAGGTASSEFQIGHCLDNRTETAVSALVTFKIDFAHQLSATPSSDQPSMGTVALKLYIKDSSERIIAKLDLLTSETDLGPQAGDRTEVAEFDVTMQPKTVYHFVVAGKAQSTSAPDTEANARLEIKSLSIQLRTKPAAG